MTHDEILAWLCETDEARLADLWQRADQVRQQWVGGEVHLRGLVELSNHCVRLCGYCGLRAPNRALERYRMSAEEVLDCARQAVAFGYGTVVLQSGEDPGIGAEWMAELIRRIKAETPLAVTLSLGERDEDDLALWRRAGADRYLLRFETSNPALYRRIHPAREGRPSDRIALLAVLGHLGYEVGSGVMIGIPGQTYADLARDVAWFARLRLEMIGVGPYLPHPRTPLGRDFFRPAASEDGAAARGPAAVTSDPATSAEFVHDEHRYNRDGTMAGSAEGDELPPEAQRRETASASADRLARADQQVPNDELTTCKVIALARLVCPWANIPSTTALATLDPARGRELGLVRGANVVMPNLTPPRYRRLYEIYPGKACVDQTGEACHAALLARLRAVGRVPGRGPGSSARPE